MRVACSCPRNPARPLFDQCGRGALQEEKAETSRKHKKAHTDHMLAQHRAVPRVCALQDLAGKQVVERGAEAPAGAQRYATSNKAHKTFTDADDQRIR